MSDVNCWTLVNNVMPYVRRLLLFGPPGTGKTYVATVGVQNVYSITLTDAMPVAELRGHFVPKGNEFIWMDGPAIRAWREGTRLVLNEIDHASDEVQTFLHVLLDDTQTAVETLPTGETVRPQTGFRVIATMNGLPEDLPPALADRFPVKIEIDEINPEAVAQLPNDLREIAVKTSNVKDLKRRLSIRVFEEYAVLRKQIGVDLAGPACFAERWKDLDNAIRIGDARGA